MHESGFCVDEGQSIVSEPCPACAHIRAFDWQLWTISVGYNLTHIKYFAQKTCLHKHHTSSHNHTTSHTLHTFPPARHALTHDIPSHTPYAFPNAFAHTPSFTPNTKGTKSSVHDHTRSVVYVHRCKHEKGPHQGTTSVVYARFSGFVNHRSCRLCTGTTMI